MEDNHLARLAAKGDRDALSSLIARYRNYVYTIVYKIVLSEEDALDVTQSVFLRLVEKIGTFNPEGNFRPWLATLAIHASVDHARKGKRETVARAAGAAWMRWKDATSPSGSAEIVNAIERSERRRIVESAMSELSPQQRAIFALRLMEDMRPGEIAERMNIAPKQVSSQLRRAMVKLREVLEKKEPSRRRAEN